ncbi:MULTISPECIES: hypothetical protein [Pseudomonas]|jgi:hypothetical protein|uniref:hypothetical protein n=1 Tax=Pseudomonas sp. BF-RE-29 TaxID=2832378 RepID=UPI001CBC8932|nr:hypothetical protein [Pseudomonas sp. BF-RE-29]
MPYAYEGPATVTVMALYMGQEPNELTTLELLVVLSNAGPRIARIEYGRYLQGPKDANALRVVLPDGRLLHGPIIDGRNDPDGGWLEFEVKDHDLGRVLPANLSWKWV